MPKVITTQATDEMAALRSADLQYNFPELKREDFADEAAYREALVKQYQALRSQEYTYVVRNETMKAYNVASEANRGAGNKKTENNPNGAWCGYKQYEASSDSCYSRVPDMVRIGKTPTSGQSCAISANAMTIQISDKMGYTGKDNLIVPRSRVVDGHVGKKNNLSAASYIHLQDSIPAEYRVSYENKAKPSLNSAIQQGIVKAGDEISLVTGGAQGNTTTGCHAMVIVDVQKDDKGNVVNYTLHGNNPPCLEVIDAKNPSYYGNRPLNSAIRTSQWMSDKIAGEIPTNMSLEELERKVSDTRTRVSSTIESLHTTETHYAEKKHYNDVKPVGRSEGYGNRYNADLEKARDVQLTREQGGVVAEEPVVQVAEQTVRESATPEVSSTQASALAQQPKAKFRPIPMKSIKGLDFPEVAEIKVKPVQAEIKIPEIPVPELATKGKKKKTKKEVLAQVGQLPSENTGSREASFVTMKQQGGIEKGVAVRDAQKGLAQPTNETVRESLRGKELRITPDGKIYAVPAGEKTTETPTLTKKPSNSAQLLAYLREKQNGR